MNDQVENFVETAREFCDWIESKESEKTIVAKNALIQITSLFQVALLLPSSDNDLDTESEQGRDCC